MIAPAPLNNYQFVTGSDDYCDIIASLIVLHLGSNIDQSVAVQRPSAPAAIPLRFMAAGAAICQV
jgi:hypothetical protein